MNKKKINQTIEAIDSRVRRIDSKLTAQFPAWGTLTALEKTICIAIAILMMWITVVIQIAGILLWYSLWSSMWSFLCFINEHPQTMLAICGIIWTIVILIQIRRNDIIFALLATVLVLVCLLLMKHVTALVGADSTYIDGALRIVSDIPRIIIEVVLPWFKEALAPLRSALQSTL